MLFYKIILFVLFVLIQIPVAQADLDYLCKKLKLDACEQRRYSRTGGTSIPSESNSYRINPSSIPIEKGIGGEVITARGIYDYGVVTGTGKIGAAVSPTSMQDTFFSNIAIENDADYIIRKRNREEYKSQKVTVATGTRLFKNKSKLITPSIGLIGKYGKDSKQFHPGAGLSINFGPLNLGYSINKDDYFDPLTQITFDYTTTNTTFGVKLPYVAVDYSIVVNSGLPGVNDTELKILSSTLFIKNFMLTYATRTELSYRLKYYYESDSFMAEEEKKDYFLGLQYTVKGKYILGIFNNYFLNREYSFGLTVFF